MRYTSSYQQRGSFDTAGYDVYGVEPFRLAGAGSQFYSNAYSPLDITNDNTPPELAAIIPKWAKSLFCFVGFGSLIPGALSANGKVVWQFGTDMVAGDFVNLPICTESLFLIFLF